MRLLLEHPALRELKGIGLRTRDAQRFYAALGFEACEGPHTQMVLRRWQSVRCNYACTTGKPLGATATINDL